MDLDDCPSSTKLCASSRQARNRTYRRARFCRVAIQISYGQEHRSGNHRHAFGFQMSLKWDVITARRLESHYERFIFCGIAPSRDIFAPAGNDGPRLPIRLSEEHRIPFLQSGRFPVSAARPMAPQAAWRAQAQVIIEATVVFMREAHVQSLAHYNPAPNYSYASLRVRSRSLKLTRCVTLPF